MEARVVRGITKIQLFNRLLIAFIIVSLIFTVLFYLGLKPTDIYYAVMPVTASKDKTPTFVFAIYGQGDNKLRRPMDVAVNGGSVYITDADANRVLVFNQDGKFKFGFGKPGSGEGELNFPYGVAIDEQNRIYVSDMKNHRIQVFNSEGKFIKFFPVNNGSFVSPGGLAIKNKQLYVVDIIKHKVFVFGLNGEKKLEFGQPGRDGGQFKYPNGIAVDDKGNIFIADSGNNRVQVFDNKGKLVKNFNGSNSDSALTYASPRGIKILNDKFIFVVNALSSQVFMSDMKGDTYNRFGFKSNENTGFDFPNGITIDKDRIYITDSLNHGIKVYKL